MHKGLDEPTMINVFKKLDEIEAAGIAMKRLYYHNDVDALEQITATLSNLIAEHSSKVYQLLEDLPDVGKPNVRDIGERGGRAA